MDFIILRDLHIHIKEDLILLSSEEVTMENIRFLINSLIAFAISFDNSLNLSSNLKLMLTVNYFIDHYFFIRS